MKNTSKRKKVSEIKNIDELISTRHSINVNVAHEERLTAGDKIADRLADFAGSWTFILLFIGVLLSWILLNSAQIFFHAFDPYPFILLNLVLSCIAAIQAPVIMMSQNRQEKRDRIKAEQDYEINLKSEILIEEMMNRLIRLEDNQKILIENQEKLLHCIQEKKSN